MQEKLSELEKQLEEIRERRSHEEDQLATLDSDAAEKVSFQSFGGVSFKTGSDETDLNKD